MFNDIGHLNAEARTAIEWCTRAGLIRGTGPTTFSPDAPLTRWQEALLTYRAANWVQMIVAQYRQATVHTFNPNLLKTGAGLFVNQLGTILTNKHVILGADNTTAPWTQYLKTEWGLAHFDPTQLAPQIVYDLNDPIDLAAIKLYPVHRERLPAVLPLVPLSDVDPVEGEPCVAVGSPLSYSNWISDGKVSLWPCAVPGMPHEFIGTTAGINPGNSGGPLLSADGRVLGICALKPWYNSGWGMAPGDDMGFAIPVRVIREWCAKRGIPLG